MTAQKGKVQTKELISRTDGVTGLVPTAELEFLFDAYIDIFDGIKDGEANTGS